LKPGKSSWFSYYQQQQSLDLGGGEELQELGEESHYAGLEEGRGVEGQYELEFTSPNTEESCIPLSPIEDRHLSPCPDLEYDHEAGIANSGGRKGGRGKGSGGMAKSKRGKRGELDDINDSNSGGLFNMDGGSGSYRTHMLFPGRKEDELGADPRRSSGSPSFMKAMMSWGKRPSDPRAAQEMQRYRSTPTRTESGANGPPAPPGRGRGRGPMTREELQKLREEELANQQHGKDCFIIPQANLDRFLPDGVTLPREPRKTNQMINILEVEDPKLIVCFHLMGQLNPLSAVMENPLVNHMDLHLDLSKQLLKSAQDQNATEGYLFKNLEKDADYPYINYYVINKPRNEAGQFYTTNKLSSHDTLSASRLGYSLNHSMDLYDEVATIARPPVDPSHKQPSTLATGYIICIYQVFKGDDGEKFERNWLYWTGARMLYKNLPRNVGLKRLTLHKSATGPNVNYILLVECSHFLDNINQAANLLPVLRARICGYTGIFRIVESF